MNAGVAWCSMVPSFRRCFFIRAKKIKGWRPPCDVEPNSTSDILFEGDRADIPKDAAPIDIVRDIILWSALCRGSSR